jgi:hypothetical protein
MAMSNHGTARNLIETPSVQQIIDQFVDMYPKLAVRVRIDTR